MMEAFCWKAGSLRNWQKWLINGWLGSGAPPAWTEWGDWLAYKKISQPLKLQYKGA
jgi:hypothetical protein